MRLLTVRQRFKIKSRANHKSVKPKQCTIYPLVECAQSNPSSIKMSRRHKLYSIADVKFIENGNARARASKLLMFCFLISFFIFFQALPTQASHLSAVPVLPLDHRPQQLIRPPSPSGHLTFKRDVTARAIAQVGTNDQGFPHAIQHQNSTASPRTSSIQAIHNQAVKSFSQHQPRNLPRLSLLSNSTASGQFLPLKGFGNSHPLLQTIGPQPQKSKSSFFNKLELSNNNDHRQAQASINNLIHYHRSTQHQSSIELVSTNNQRQRAVGLLEKICIGTSNGLSINQHNKSEHYQNLYERYKNCTYVMGNLELTWLERGNGDDEHHSSLDLSFLESIREISGYLLIAHVNIATIRMPNLQIIRGRDLFKSEHINEKEELFALMLIENELKSLELPNLAEILIGSVGSYNNRNLCHISTIEWSEILAPSYKSIFVYNGAQPECPPCDLTCLSRCWAEGPEMCQKFSKTNCAPICGNRCFGSTSSDCCHQFCAGGCTGPNQTDCLACKNFYDNGSCVQECPSLMRYNPSKFLWEPNPNGKFAFGATCVKECPENMLRDSGACVRVCPPNKRSFNGECVPCGGPCPKNCQGVEVVHSGNIDQLINCTVIEGSITILDESFSGCTEFVQAGQPQLSYQQQQGHPQNQQHHQALQNQVTSSTLTYCNGVARNQSSSSGSSSGLSETKHKPMHPSRLEMFKTILEITGYLTIRARHPDFKDLSYFTNLKTIGGRQTTDMFHALSITRTSLVSLNFRSLRRVRSGKITIEDNPELCFADTIDWQQIDISRREDVTIRNNAESSKCRAAGLQCHEQCARDGCWGPGPDECLSCTNYKLDDYCVVNCTSTGTLGFLAYEDSSQARICKRCHPECSQGCNGTEARHCHACKSVKDGPYCVSECPSHKYNNNGTCEECDKSCGPEGCSGPSNKLGEGGCNSCAKAIIRQSSSSYETSAPHNQSIGEQHTTSSAGFNIECIRAEEPCPDGYYQEYVVGSTQPDGSPLKSSSGRPVCRRCHHRCKRCIGMGTHRTVCECAKYVAGEQCEDHCPRDYYADEDSRQCVKCSPECNGCFGPTEADCISCRVYRIYYETNSPQAHSGGISSSGPSFGPLGSGGSAGSTSQTLLSMQTVGGEGPSSTSQTTNQRLRFNCTAQCPSDKPHRISESNMLDPYCSEDPGIDIESPLIVSLGSRSSLFLIIISSALMVCISIHRCQLDRTYKMTMQLSGIEDAEPLTPSNLKPNLAPLRSIKESELSEGKVLGSGFGGTVHQGFWRPEGKDHSIPVAIKKLREKGQSNINKEFLEEAYVMASVDHPNLVRLLAVCMTPKNPMLITQLMALGCLLDYVRANKNIGSKNLLEWGKQIARGMAYLEERRLVHRDLALRNVLLQTPRKALISDFGLAKFLDVNQSEYHSAGGRLPIKWLAPECILSRRFTHKSDVWAFGVTIWELVTFGQPPFEEYETHKVPLAVEKGARLKQPNNVSAELYKVMYACWFYTPEDRPNFKQLVQSFVNFARDPERYLICGSKGLKLCKGLSVVSYANDDEANNHRKCDNSDIYDEDEQQTDLDDIDQPAEIVGEESFSNDGLSPTLLPSNHRQVQLQQQTISGTTPNLTPSTHNRLNEMFGFELQRHRASESSDLNGPSSSLTTPILKRIEMFACGQQQQAQANQQHRRLNANSHNHLTHHHVTHLGPPPKSIKGSVMVKDVNNNTTFAHNNSSNQTGCCPMHHTVSSNSLGQPTDAYGYALPSPCTNEHGHTFVPYGTYGDNSSDSFSMRNPPHSAGIVSNITNEEYFQTRANYINDDYDDDEDAQNLSTSSENVPQSLV